MQRVALSDVDVAVLLVVRKDLDMVDGVETKRVL